MKFLIPHAVFLLLIYLTWKSIRKDVAIDAEQARYLFENRNESGTVNYSSFDEMQRLERRWNGARLRMILKAIPLCLLVIIELIVTGLSLA